MNPVHGEKAATGATNADTTYANMPTVEEKRLVLKMDLRIMPVLTVVYIMAFIDRVNIGNAQLFSLSSDLALHGNQYNIALSVFFVSYIVFEIPANVLMRKIKPHVFMSGCMFLYGFLVTMQGLVSNFGGLVVTRFLLGIAEAGVFPGCFYLLSMWYKRLEAQRRFSFFVNAATFAGAFGSLLATGIGHMDGIRGYHAWRWIFILEGLATCVLALGAFFLVSDFRRIHTGSRLAEDQGESDLEAAVTWKETIRLLRNPRTIVAGFMYFGLTMSGYSLAYFIPTIVASHGYSPIQSQVHSIPPWAAALGFSMVLAYTSDKTRQRFPYIVFSFLMALAGAITLFRLHHNRYAQYGALCLYTMGVFGAVPIVICWYVMNLEGHRNRAIGTAWQVAFGNTAGIISTFAFPVKDRPTYQLGYSLGIAFLCLSLVANAAYFALCMMDNRKRDGKRKLIL
ncbi:major facilitator superfamily domain-containing protein [Massariosphaeria phaeospora]|uniref:Major facilitator superfamily domain-containing protein n=1 Tax=Massariosphaeria phaeospora TaxID=100035 RepID=A0A7C8I894_9PLEO|nr:major facilitator superfamily domain-containing protein [Massariosphaeria phaeospora]